MLAPHYDYVRFLDEISKDDGTLVGGKGANLGEMQKGGLNVPEALVVTTKAYRAFLEANKADVKIAELLDGINVDDADELEERFRRVQRIMESSPISEEVVKEIL
jgi:phosphoenolpyruvate synthase/pyruvate phosphate dikinase